MKQSLRCFEWLLLAALCVGSGAPAVAHEARPLAVHIEEQGKDLYRIDLRIPGSITPDNQPRIVWPDDCKPVGQQFVQCASPLAGRKLGIAYALYNPSVTALWRYTPLDGRTRTAVLPPEVALWSVPIQPGALRVAKDYLLLGIEHILGGWDHLLFVAGLLLIARTARRILLAITGFTLAHSLTLSLAALGVVHVPVAPTETCIALSILFLAREATRAESTSLVHRFPLLVSALFGLLHGLGFAAALGEVGLPDNEIVWALLFFNFGVEVGQLAFILAVVALVGLATYALQHSRPGQRVPLPLIARYSSYLIGIPAAFWLIQRLTVLAPA
jgi:hydrogenase/urease accessory protein HupE